ncbi:MAG: MgtC/SapB family protein [Rhodocyclaceae bacterium]
MIDHTDILLRLALAAVLGALIGLDRERLAWAAGLRTHMMVSVGAALFMLVSAYGFADALNQPGDVRLDVSRVAAQVASGIGFLGAGTIMLRRQIIHGLTTAASLWSVAAVGLAAGGGMYFAAIGATALMLIILVVVKPIESRMRAARQTWIITLNVEHTHCSLASISDTIKQAGLVQETVNVKSTPDSTEDEVRIGVRHAPMAAINTALHALRAGHGVHQVTLDSAKR